MLSAGISEYDSDHILSTGFALSAPLDFFVNLRAKHAIDNPEEIASMVDE